MTSRANYFSAYSATQSQAAESWLFSGYWLGFGFCPSMPGVSARNLYFLPSGAADVFNVVIEIPYGSQNKYELDPETGVLTLDRVLYSAEFYPFNYGFIPSTKAEDGDALDVAVLLTNPVPPMTVLQARPIGMIKKVDSGQQDNLILAVPVSDPRFHDIDDVSQLPKHKVEEITDFFANYKRLQDKVVVIQGVFGRVEAEAEVAAHLNNYTRSDEAQ